MTSRPNIEALRRQIRNVRCESIEKRPFVPAALLQSFFTPHAIKEAVSELDCQPEDRIGLGNAICSDGITTFAVLIWMGREDAIVDFRRWQYLNSIRLSEETAIRIAPSFGVDFVREVAWQFRPHFFRLGENVEMDEREILPFLRETGVANEGGFGLVSKVEIHPLLQNFCPGSAEPVIIVRKALRKGASDDHRRTLLFDQERRSLVLLNSRRHPNIVPFLGSYKHQQELCFLFPVLDMDLKQFFQRDRCYGNFNLDITFIAALCGLASALSFVHEVRLRPDIEGVDFTGLGYHHDLRPANILVTKETFVLADFGLGRLKPSGQESRTRWEGGAGDYFAPECMDDKLIGLDVGRAIDVWAFGCLMAEVLTFMRKGSEGLQDFCEARLSAGSLPGFETTYFYDNSGNLKSSVKNWLDQVVDECGRHTADSLVQNLIVDILLPVHERPKILDISNRLSFFNLKAHYDSAKGYIQDIVERMSDLPDTSQNLMKFWFERQRLMAFGKVICADGDMEDAEPPEVVRIEGEKFAKILKSLIDRVSGVVWPTTSLQTGGPITHDNLTESQSQKFVISGTSQETASTSVVADIQSSIQQLWDLLPKVELKKVEAAWVNAMGKMDEVKQLRRLEEALSAEEATVYQQGAALAMMRRIRLELDGHVQRNPDLTNMELAASDVTNARKIDRHEICIYKRSIPAIIEWMHYDQSWKSIPPEERAMGMALKAKGFGTASKPRGLRTLHCLGFFERDRGYGFVYEIPRHHERTDQTCDELTTLNSLLRRSASLLANHSRSPAKASSQSPKRAGEELDTNLTQPLLGDKYRLAFMLAEFVMEFHAIGWLHENLHSNNIVFFETPPDKQPIGPHNSSIINQPYVLGLHKSRPGSDQWHTQGPMLNTDFPDYEHPAYEMTRHFRCSYDYFTLGIVLLEVGLWAPLEAWKTNNPGLRRGKLRDVLLKKYVPRLGPRMGSVYEDIVGKLLRDGLDPDCEQRYPDPENESRVFNSFFDKVFSPLAAISETPI